MQEGFTAAHGLHYQPSNVHRSSRTRGRYEGVTTPIYLPKSVTAGRVRDGYPLGKTAERYHLC